jgi:hypothetical protein
MRARAGCRKREASHTSVRSKRRGSRQLHRQRHRLQRDQIERQAPLGRFRASSTPESAKAVFRKTPIIWRSRDKAGRHQPKSRCPCHDAISSLNSIEPDADCGAVEHKSARSALQRANEHSRSQSSGRGGRERGLSRAVLARKAQHRVRAALAERGAQRRRKTQPLQSQSSLRSASIRSRTAQTLR